MTLREAFEKAARDKTEGIDRYQRTFELLYGRLPSNDEREMIRRRCLWFETEDGNGESNTPQPDHDD